MKHRVTFYPENAMPPAVRLTLAIQESALLRNHCYAADHCTDQIGWNAAKVTKTEIRFQSVKRGPWFALPTPLAVAKMIDAHDSGKALKRLTVEIDDSLAILVPPAKKYDSRKRHDQDATGRTRVRADGTIRGPRQRRSHSRQGFTRPMFA